MNAKKIEQNKVYEIAVGKNTTSVRVLEIDRRVNGTLVFQCENVKTGKPMSVADAARFVREIKPKAEKTLKETIESKGITIIPKERRAMSSMRNLDDPAFTRKHHVNDNGVLVLEAEDDDAPETKAESERGKGGKAKGTMSGLDAAHRVLVEAGTSMNAKQIAEAALSQSLCNLPGATPHATISAAIQMEIKRKGSESRFIKTDKGMFAAR